MEDLCATSCRYLLRAVPAKCRRSPAASLARRFACRRGDRAWRWADL